MVIKKLCYLYLVQNAVRLLEVPPWRFSSFVWHVRLWKLQASNNSIDMLFSFSQSSVTSPNRRCCMFHFNAARCTSISPALGFNTGALPYKTESVGAVRILLFMSATWEWQINRWYVIYFIRCYTIHIQSLTSGAMRSRRRKGSKSRWFWGIFFTL